MKSINTHNRFAGAGLHLHRLVSTCLFLVFSLVMMTGCRRELPRIQAAGYDLQLVADNFVSPLGVVVAPDNTNRLFVFDQVGKVWIVNPDGTKNPNPFIDISSKMVTLMGGYDE